MFLGLLVICINIVYLQVKCLNTAVGKEFTHTEIIHQFTPKHYNGMFPPQENGRQFVSMGLLKDMIIR